MSLQLNRTTLVVDHKRRKIYVAYDKGFYYRQYNKPNAPHTFVIIKSEFIAMGVDALGNIFVIDTFNKVAGNIDVNIPISMSCNVSESQYPKNDSDSVITLQDEHEDPKHIISNNECQNEIDGFKNYPRLLLNIKEETTTNVYGRNIYDFHKLLKQETKTIHRKSRTLP